MEASSVVTTLSSGILGSTGQGDGRSSTLVPETIAVFTVAENQIAHFKARLIFRLTTPAVEVTDLRLVLPNANLIVYYLQASIGDTSIFRVGVQHETQDSLIFSFGQQSIRSSVQFIIRGSFRYLENPTVGLVTLIFPCLIGRYHHGGTMSVFGGGLSRRHGEEMQGREMRLDVQCLLTLPLPALRSIGCSVRSVSPDGRRVFLRNLTRGTYGTTWSSVYSVVTKIPSALISS